MVQEIVMNAAPPTLPLSKRAPISVEKWTAIDLIEPCIVLLEGVDSLVVMLAKQFNVSSEGTTFHGVRVISIPGGLALRYLEIKALFTHVRLPDEQLFANASIEIIEDEHHLTIGGRRYSTRPTEFPLKELTHAEFQTMLTCSGRALRTRAVRIFRDHLPAHMIHHRPWRFMPSLSMSLPWKRPTHTYM